MLEKKKALALLMPTSDRINIMCCIIKELVELKNFHVILYSVEKYRDIVQKSGAEYRQFKNVSALDNLETSIDFFDLINVYTRVSRNVLPEIIECCNREKPDLILTDALTNFGRYLINHLEKKNKNNQLNYKLPKAVVIYPSFAFLDNIYPLHEEAELLFGKLNISLFRKLYRFSLKQQKINKQFGLTFPINFKSFLRAMNSEKHLHVCAVLQELQPRADKFIHRFNFIGCCISEEVRNFEIKNEKLKYILDIYGPKNPITIEKWKEDVEKKLIYASLGTLSKINISVFDKIIEAFENFEQEPDLTKSNIRSNELEIVISVGDAIYEKFQERFIKEKYSLPDNILIVPSVPQIEILKRASLFISHAGMNSTSEAIHFGVPMICLPITFDEPLVAIRICDELKFGKKLDFKKFTSNEMRTCMHEVMSNQKYTENILEFSRLSQRKNGCEIGANLIDEYLKN